MSQADLDSKTVKDVVFETFSEPGGKTFMTAAEELKLVGKEEGIKEGIEKGKLEIAKKMLTEGLYESYIHKVTGLSLKDIEKLKE